MEEIVEKVGVFDVLESQSDMFQILNNTLQYRSGDPQATSTKLAEDMVFFCQAKHPDTPTEEFARELWHLVLYMVMYIPSEFSWSERMVEALDKLHQRGTILSQTDPSGNGKNFVTLPESLRQVWSYPSKDEAKELAMTRSLNSFAARLRSRHFAIGMHFPIWELRDALEEPIARGERMECQIWVACEWIIRCGQDILDFLRSDRTLSQSEALEIETGYLLRDGKAMGDERWTFWEKRFATIAAEADSLQLSKDTRARIAEALQTMKAIDSKDCKNPSY